jgi:hypothetical protein
VLIFQHMLKLLHRAKRRGLHVRDHTSRSRDEANSVPWILLYALSTIAMNHREAFRLNVQTRLPWEKESEQVLRLQFSAGATPEFMGRQILQILHLDGSFRATLSADKNTLAVLRKQALAPRRITYSLAGGHLLVERQPFLTQPFLERMHHRRGYGASFVADNGWAVSVDAVIVAITLWVLSGLWMWWELKTTRFIGGIVALSGVALFVALILTS